MGALQLIGQALRLDPAAFESLIGAQQLLRVSLWVVFFAGLSSALGQSIVLFMNRVKPNRFVASLIISALLYVVGFLFWTLSIWLVASTLFQREQQFLLTLQAVGLAYSPQLFGFFVLTPYLGSFIAGMLSVWNLLAILIASQVIFDLTLPQAAACSGIGWLLLQVAQRTVGRPLLSVTNWFRSKVAGTPLAVRSVRELLQPEEEENRAGH
jgi:hypothetical protein